MNGSWGSWHNRGRSGWSWGRGRWGERGWRTPPAVDRWFGDGRFHRYWRQAQWAEVFTYDDRGNIATKTNGWGTVDYEYTAENRVAQVVSNQAGFVGTRHRFLEVGVAYSYDAFGRRASREDITDIRAADGIRRHGSRANRESYLYDGLGFNVLAEGIDTTAETQEDGWYTGSTRVFHPTSEYVTVGRTVIARNDITNREWSFHHHRGRNRVETTYYSEDILGSVRMLSNERGHQTEEYRYDIYGQVVAGDFSNGNRLGYNGKRTDPVTGWYNYGYRDYSPTMMRFTTVDPIRDGNNWYAYVGNDPVNLVDPLGLLADEPGNGNAAIPTNGLGEALTLLAGAEVIGLGVTLGVTAGKALAAGTVAGTIGGGIFLLSGAITTGVGIDLLKGDGLDETMTPTPRVRSGGEQNPLETTDNMRDLSAHLGTLDEAVQNLGGYR